LISSAELGRPLDQLRGQAQDLLRRARAHAVLDREVRALDEAALPQGVPESVEVAPEARVVRGRPQHADPRSPGRRLRDGAAPDHAASMPHRARLC